MTSVSETQASRLFVILNPKAGTCTADVVKQAVGRHFSCEDGSCRIHETSGHENLAELARSAVDQGCDLIVAAGGDGTVSGVAEGLIGSRASLGIIPLGTANVLARELGIPVNLEAACTLLAGAHTLADIDAMRINNQHYFTQVGVGIDALMIRDTKTEHKRQFGRAAYLWTAGTRLIGFQPRRFTLEVDGQTIRRRASQVVLANVGTLGQPPFRWGPGIRPDDARIDVCIVRARTFWHYVALAWHVVRGEHRQDRNVRYFVARQSVTVSLTKPLPVQADGEVIGETPILMQVVPKAVRVVAPVSTEVG
ncbi:MAG: diacylglycerol kinase family protein [Isosphaeraceae bacterium]